jgi:hypothetical protein
VGDADASDPSWPTIAAGSYGVCVTDTACGAAGRRGGQFAGRPNWILLDGPCNGQPAQLLDPRGGNTAFLVGGSVGVGKHFRATNASTGAVLEETFTGRGIADDRLFYCRFLFEDVPTPSGTIDVLLEVWGLPTPQGP